MEETEELAFRKARAGVRSAIQQNPPPSFATKGALVTGWSLVAEWMDPDGEKWLSRLDSEDLTSWAREGMFFEALGDWEEDED